MRLLRLTPHFTSEQQDQRHNQQSAPKKASTSLTLVLLHALFGSGQRFAAREVFFATDRARRQGNFALPKSDRDAVLLLHSGNTY